MRAAAVLVLGLLSAQAGADSLRLSIGARVLDRCSATPTAGLPRVRCVAAGPLVPRFETTRTAAGTTITILF